MQSICPKALWGENRTRQATLRPKVGTRKPNTQRVNSIAEI